jgi:hypothetical protein
MVKIKTQKQKQRKKNKSRKNAWNQPNETMLSLQFITKLIKDYV